LAAAGAKVPSQAVKYLRGEMAAASQIALETQAVGQPKDAIVSQIGAGGCKATANSTEPLAVEFKAIAREL
jgi:hypothetical protein